MTQMTAGCEGSQGPRQGASACLPGSRGPQRAAVGGVTLKPPACSLLLAGWPWGRSFGLCAPCSSAVREGGTVKGLLERAPGRTAGEQGLSAGTELGREVGVGVLLVQGKREHGDGAFR